MKTWLTAPRMRVVILTAVTTYFVGILLKRYIPEEKVDSLLPKTLAKKDEGTSA
ncbi:MAG: hypothetical protein PHS46_08485 [Candidatus Omnitrophica bacterium]|nr:hypothetical protein [Candidatus Omnitrophota bacterium]